jgi:membrane associated rhomboid family serine protease
MQHAGIFHIALSCWALVSFGPQVCKGYGSFTFFLIYILGGVSGNLASFVHTPDPTVGGTVSITLQLINHTINLRSDDQNQ